MKTVTAKELRENLSAYMDQVEAGEEIAVIRRSNIIGRFKPVKKTFVKNNGAGIVAATEEYYKYLDENGIKFSLDPNKSIKELYRESMKNDPKYSRYAKPDQ